MSCILDLKLLGHIIHNMIKTKMNNKTRIKLRLTEMHNKLFRPKKRVKIEKQLMSIHNDSIKKERKNPKNLPKYSVPEGNDKMKQNRNNKYQFKNTLKNANISTRHCACDI